MKTATTILLLFLSFFAFSQDIAVQNLATNFSPCTVNSTPVTIMLEVANLDTTAIPANQITMRYEVGSTIVNQTITSSIAPLQSVAFQFTTPLNLQNHIGQNITISANLAIDTILSNNSYTRVIKSAQPNTTYYFEDFENHTMGTTFNQDELQSWTRNPSQGSILNDFMWRVQKGAAPFAYQIDSSFHSPPIVLGYPSGPSGDHTLANNFKNGNGTYLLLNTYLNPKVPTTSPSDATIEFPCNPIVPNGNLMMLEFWYHLHTARPQKLYIDVFNGLNWINDVDSVFQNRNFSAGSIWEKKQVDLSSFSNSLGLKVRFRAKFISVNSAVQGSDIAIDDVKLYARPNRDIALPPRVNLGSVCSRYFSDFEVQTLNLGIDSLRLIPINAEVTLIDSVGAKSVFPIMSDTIFAFQNPILPLEAYQFSLFRHTDTNSLQLSQRGDYTIKVWANLLGDLNPQNDTTIYTLYNHTRNVNEIEGFEDFILEEKAVNYYDNTFPQGWETYSNYGGFYASNGTISNFSAPSNILADQFLKYDNPLSQIGSANYLSSPCFDVSQQINQDLEFDLYISDTNQTIEFASRAIGSVYNFDTLSGKGLNLGWNRINFPLYDYQNVGAIQFRLKEILNINAIAAIDNFGIVDPKPNQIQNLGITNIDTLNCYYGTNETVSIKVINIGNGPIDSFLVSLKLNKDSISANGTYLSFDSAWIYPTNFQFGDTQTVVLSPTNLQLDLSQEGRYFVTSSVSLAIDNSPKNINDKVNSIKHDSSRTIPYFEDFENDNLIPNSNTYQNGFSFNSIYGSQPTSWLITNTYGLNGPLNDHTLGIGHQGKFATNQISVSSLPSFTSPCIDISGSISPSIDYYVYSYSSFPSQPIKLYLSINEGNGWTLIDSIIGNIQTSLTEPWHYRYSNLSLSPSATHIQLRFQVYPINGNTNFGAIAIDDISVRDLFLTRIEEQSENRLTLSPNPSNGLYNLNSTNNLAGIDYQVIDIKGQLIQGSVLKNRNNQIDLSNSPAGIYFLQINELGIREKLIKY